MTSDPRDKKSKKTLPATTGTYGIRNSYWLRLAKITQTTQRNQQNVKDFLKFSIASEDY